MSQSKSPADIFQFTLARLHLQAVLPALEDLTEASPAARETARLWKFPLRMQLAGSGGASTTMIPRDGLVRVRAGTAGSATEGEKAAMTLLFLSPKQLNRTFLNQSALPPVPLGKVWHLAGLKPFTALTKLLNAALQPDEAKLADPAFLRLHARLLFKVLIGAVPVVGEADGPSTHTLAATPPGLAELRMAALGLMGWVRWDGKRLTAGTGEVPAKPDARISFRDEMAAIAALRSQLDNAAAVGLGQIEINGLVPLADSLGVVMDRVEGYLKPKAQKKSMEE